MGHADLYPFVLPVAVLNKMQFIHTVIESYPGKKRIQQSGDRQRVAEMSVTSTATSSHAALGFGVDDAAQRGHVRVVASHPTTM